MNITKEHGDYVYALVDPRDSRIYYIGGASYLRHRLTSHLSEARHRKSTRDHPKNIWLRDLMSSGHVPIVVVVGNGVWFNEKKWIAILYRLGAPLTNFVHINGEVDEIMLDGLLTRATN